MIPQVPTALAILLMAASLAPQTPQGSDPGRFVTGGGITLRLEPYRGPTCELTVHVDVWAASNGRRSVALSCESRGAHRTLITGPNRSQDRALAYSPDWRSRKVLRMTFARHVASCSLPCGGAIQITQRQERLTLYRCTQCSMKGQPTIYSTTARKRYRMGAETGAGDDYLIAENKRGSERTGSMTFEEIKRLHAESRARTGRDTTAHRECEVCRCHRL